MERTKEKIQEVISEIHEDIPFDYTSPSVRDLVVKVFTSDNEQGRFKEFVISYKIHK